jgi:hypothetical protein
VALGAALVSRPGPEVDFDGGDPAALLRAVAAALGFPGGTALSLLLHASLVNARAQAHAAALGPQRAPGSLSPVEVGAYLDMAEQLAAAADDERERAVEAAAQATVETAAWRRVALVLAVASVGRLDSGR